MTEETPETMRRKVDSVATRLTQATLALKRARDDEVTHKHEFEAAERRAILSAECPKVTRGGVTTAERDAWVADQAAEAQRAYEIAEVTRKAAEDNYRTINTQSVLASALLKSIDLAFNVSGRAQTT